MVLIVLALLAVFGLAFWGRDHVPPAKFDFSSWVPNPPAIKVTPRSYDVALTAMRAWQMGKPASEILPTSESQNYLAVVPANEYVARPKALVVQLGSFTNVDNAKALVALLQAQNIPAYVGEFSQKGIGYYRVLIGPALTKDQVQDYIQQMKGLTKLQPIVRTLVG